MFAPPPVATISPPLAAAPPPPLGVIDDGMGLAMGPPPVIYDDDDDYYEENWVYSRFALPWLLVVLVCLLILFYLTTTQQVGNVKDLWDGVPRYFVRKDVDELDEQAGTPNEVRNLRIAAFVVGILGVIVGFLAYFLRPKPGIRKALGALAAVLLIICAVLAWIAFAIALDNYKAAVQCPYLYRITGENCDDRSGVAIAAIAIDAFVGVLAIVAALLVAINSIKGHWKIPARSWEEEQVDLRLEKPETRRPAEMIMRNRSWVQRILTALALFFVLLGLLAMLIFTLLIHEDREVERLYGPRGRARRSQVPPLQYNPYVEDFFEESGWPRVNTRIRYAGIAVGVITILLNFLPFRSRAVAILFAFLYWISAVLLLIAFGYDVHMLRWVSRLDCPDTIFGALIECRVDRYIATAAMDFITVLVIIIYLIVEFTLGSRKQGKIYEY